MTKHGYAPATFLQSNIFPIHKGVFKGGSVFKPPKFSDFFEN